jgi:hypothetical protein
MSDAKYDLTREESDSDVESRRDRPSASPDDHLMTRRMPAISPPPMRPGTLSSPPPPPAIPRMPSFVPGIEGVGSAGYSTDAPAGAQPRASWWRALLTTTFAPAASASALDANALRRRMAAACAGLALGLVLLALVLGFRSAPSLEPAVAAAVVVSRALVALGMIAFGGALLRTAERFLAASGLLTPAESADGQGAHARGDVVRQSSSPGFN